MNEQTAKLLEQLAIKLGTTSEYLWGILLKQAPIDATISLMQLVGLIAFGLVLWKIHKKLMSVVENDKYNESYYEKYDAGAVVPMVIAIFVWGVILIFFFFSFDTIISGYFNPEYWALKEISNSLRGCN